MTAAARRGRADYGFDAPYVPLFLRGWGTVLIVVAVITFVVGSGLIATAVLLLGLFTLLSGISFVYTTRRGKWYLWAVRVAELPLTGRERVLDIVCGRGAVLVRAANRIPDGHTVGIDLWHR